MDTDPVCKMPVAPQKDTVRAEYRGVTYYFCSERCHQEFTRHPEKYATEPHEDLPGGHGRGGGCC